MIWPFAALALAGLVLAGSAAAAPADRVDVRVTGQHAFAGGYAIDLGEPDDAAAPRVWQGPVVIKAPGGRSCRVSEDVELIDRPLKLLRGRWLYVDASSGSADRVFVVDATNCAIAWTSPVFDGPSRISDDRLLIYGLGAYRIGANGLPERQPATRVLPPLGSDADAALSIDQSVAAALRRAPAIGRDDWRDLALARQAGVAGGYRFDFKYAADREIPPRQWSGPVVITAPDGTSCEVDDVVEDIRRPVALLGGRLLYLAATRWGPGATPWGRARFFVVDVASCAVVRASLGYRGSAVIRADTLRLHGLAPFRIDAHGLPPPTR